MLWNLDIFESQRDSIAKARLARTELFWLVFLSRGIRRAVQITGRVLSLALIGHLAHAAERPADIVVLNGRIVTVDAQFSIVQAVAIRDGLFIAVGVNEDVKKHAGE